MAAMLKGAKPVVICESVKLPLTVTGAYVESKTSMVAAWKLAA